MTRERIEDMREVVLPFVKKRLLETNYEGLGKSDAEEFEKDFNAILDLAIKALEKESTTAVWSNYDKDDITQRAWHDVQTCSKCGMGGKHYDEFKYCPNCGKIMTNAKGWGNRWK